MRRPASTHRLIPISALGATLLIAGCGGGFFDDITSSSQGQLRLVNATSNLAALELFLDSSRISGPAEPYSAGAYASLDDGSRTLVLRSSGSSADIATTTATVTKGVHSMAVAYSTGGNVAVAYLTEEEGAPSSGNAKLRVFNGAAADSGNVDVYIVNAPCTTLASSPTAPLTADVGAKETAYVQLAATPSGSASYLCLTAPGDKNDVRLSSAGFVLESRQVATLLIVRSTGGFLFNALLVTQQGAVRTALNPSARLRLAASSAASAAIGVTVPARAASGAAPAASSVSFGPLINQATEYQIVPAGTFTPDIAANGQAVTAPGSVSLDAGSDATLLVTAAGSSAAPRLKLLPHDNALSSSTTRSVKVRLVNGIRDADGTSFSAQLQVGGSSVGGLVEFEAQSSIPPTIEPGATATTLSVLLQPAATTFSTSFSPTAKHVYTAFVLGGSAPTVNRLDVHTDR